MGLHVTNQKTLAKTIASIFGCIALLCNSANADTITIDDFNVGAITKNITGATDNGPIIVQPGLNPDHVAGGTRELYLAYCCGSETGVLIGSVDTNGMGSFVYDGTTAGFQTESFRLSYGNWQSNPLGIDVSANPLNTLVIRVVKTDFASYTEKDFSIWINGYATPFSLVNSDAPYDVVIPIVVDVIDSVSLLSVNITPGASFTLGSIRIVPEPASAYLLTLGLACLYRHQRHTAAS